MKKLFPSTIFIAALLLLFITGGRAADNNASNNTTIQGIVLPDKVYDRQPFSFAVDQSVPGATVTLQSADGLVVQNASSDKYGRVFLPAGLPAGAYLISTSRQALGKIEIQQRAGNALPVAAHPLQLQNPPEVIKVSDRFNLNGHGFSPNFGDMSVSLLESGQTEAPIILAASEDQLKLAPVRQLQPGAAQLRVTNQATGNSTAAYNVLLYDIQGKLVQSTLTGGAQTQLLVTVVPGDLPLTVKANVVSGPVDFGHDRREAEAVTSDGQAIFPVHAERSSGPFQLNWVLAENQDFQDRDECRCNINTGKCEPEEDYFCISRQINNRRACISSHK